MKSCHKSLMTSMLRLVNHVSNILFVLLSGSSLVVFHDFGFSIHGMTSTAWSRWKCCSIIHSIFEYGQADLLCFGIIPQKLSNLYFYCHKVHEQWEVVVSFLQTLFTYKHACWAKTHIHNHAWHHCSSFTNRPSLSLHLSCSPASTLMHFTPSHSSSSFYISWIFFTIHPTFLSLKYSKFNDNVNFRKI